MLKLCRRFNTLCLEHDIMYDRVEEANKLEETIKGLRADLKAKAKLLEDKDQELAKAKKSAGLLEEKMNKADATAKEAKAELVTSEKKGKDLESQLEAARA